ncbi:MAG: AAA family ATPase [Armatimonadota bacterium]|nr:AAA family ATPase [Armatimonadota bacterium]MDR7403172.1 AAA family ATPase [Armatimonadota bacterium]
MIVRIPDPSLVVLCGPAASGKSTFARRHFLPTAVVSTDRCRAMIADDEANIRVSRDAFELFFHIIELRLRHRRLAVADSTALQPDVRLALRQLARRYEVPAVAILFDVPEETCVRWDASRPRRVGRPVIHRQWERFQQALRSVPGEGFDQVVVLGEDDIRSCRVELVPSAARAREAAPEPADG